MDSAIEMEIAKIREKEWAQQVSLTRSLRRGRLLVWFVLLAKAIGDQLICIFVDTACFVKEGDQVMESFLVNWPLNIYPRG